MITAQKRCARRVLVARHNAWSATVGELHNSTRFITAEKRLQMRGECRRLRKRYLHARALVGLTEPRGVARIQLLDMSTPVRR